MLYGLVPSRFRCLVIRACPTLLSLARFTGLSQVNIMFLSLVALLSTGIGFVGFHLFYRIAPECALEIGQCVYVGPRAAGHTLELVARGMCLRLESVAQVPVCCNGFLHIKFHDRKPYALPSIQVGVSVLEGMV